jgi:hypothetical protein
MDAASRKVLDALAESYGATLHDGLGNPVGHKPGYVFGGAVADEAWQAVADARREMIDRVSNAWRGDGRQSIPPMQGDTDADSREAAYAEYENYLTNAWRGSR